MKPHEQCLLLNADYSPISIIDWKRAMIWSAKYIDNHKYGIEIVDFYKHDFIQGVSKRYPIPAVAKTVTYFKLNRSTEIKFSRKNLFLRDNFTCQYCGKHLSYNELTYDHVIPKSKWLSINESPTNWTNIVTSCISCNRKKSNKTPSQAQMSLKSIPIRPNKNQKYLAISQHLSKIKEQIPKEWKPYLPQSYYCY